MDSLGLYINVGGLLLIALAQVLPMFPWGNIARFSKVKRVSNIISYIGALLLVLSIIAWIVGDVLTFKELL